jgi:hypothetical protein
VIKKNEKSTDRNTCQDPERKVKLILVSLTVEKTNHRGVEGSTSIYVVISRMDREISMSSSLYDGFVRSFSGSPLICSLLLKRMSLKL